MYLSDLKPGEKGKIVQINAPIKIKRRLLEMGFTADADILVLKEAPLSDPVEYLLRGCEVTLRKNDASRIEIEKVNN